MLAERFSAGRRETRYMQVLTVTRWLRWTTPILGIALIQSPVMPAQASSAVGLIAAEQLLGRIDTSMSNVVNSGDLAAANRIHQVRVETEQVLSDVRELIREGVTDENAAAVRSFTSVQDILSSLHQLTGTTERKAFLDINSTLINTSYLLPKFLGGKTFVVGIDPPRLAAVPIDKDVFFVGLFPYVSDEHPASVEVLGKRYPLRRYANNRLGFKLPEQPLPEEQFLEVKLDVPDQKQWYQLWTPTTTIYDRVYVSKTNPFAFEVAIQAENPDLWTSIVAPNELHYYADSNHTSNIGTITAPEALRLLVPDTSSLVADGAEFQAVAHREASDGPCSHVSRSAEFGGWNAQALSWRLSASSMPGHWDGLSFHGGGGSNAQIWLRPTFRVKKKGVAPTLTLATVQKRAGGGQVLKMQIPNQDWESVVIVSAFKDGDNQVSDSLVLRRDSPLGTKPGWSAEISNGTLIITTRP
jgi:hypothetical protein